MIETKIYVGLNDMDTKEQKLKTSSYVSILKKVCADYGVPFSFNIVEGGYIHENGEYTEENSIVISLIDVEPDLCEEIARDLCVLFHQESVLIASSEVEVKFVSETL